MTFRASNGNYHYCVMPFGLKNTGSIYQRMVTWMFEMQIGRNIEAYINDMVVKSKQVEEHLANLGETFSVLREHKLCLNIFKCSFGVSSGEYQDLKKILFSSYLMSFKVYEVSYLLL